MGRPPPVPAPLDGCADEVVHHLAGFGERCRKRQDAALPEQFSTDDLTDTSEAERIPDLARSRSGKRGTFDVFIPPSPCVCLNQVAPLQAHNTMGTTMTISGRGSRTKGAAAAAWLISTEKCHWRDFSFPTWSSVRHMQPA